jgi:hypothetical protein
MYGEGCLGDWSCHLIGPVATALDLDMPTAVTMDDERGFDPKKTPFSFPHAAHYKFEFPAKGNRGPLIYHWYECMRRAPRPAAYEPELPFDTVKSRWCGGYLVCEKETLMFGATGASGLRVIPHSHMKAIKPHLPPKKYPRYKDHWAEFLQAVQQKRPANTPFEMGGKFTIMGFMGMIADIFSGAMHSFGRVMDAYGRETVRYGIVHAPGMSTPSADGMTPIWTLQTYRTGLEEQRDADEEAGEAWNALEKSIVGKLADDVVVGVKGDRIEMVIIKDFDRR